MIFNPTHIIIKTGEKVELGEPFPNDNGNICVLKNHKGIYRGHEYVKPEELEVIK